MINQGESMPKTGLSSEDLAAKALAIAKRNIRRYGLGKFRLIDIARELGVTHAALYNHFPGKEAVLDEISKQWLRETDDILHRQSRLELPPKQAITAWFLDFHRRKLEKVRNDPELFKTFNMAVEAEKPFVSEHLVNMHDQLLFMVRRAISAGELNVSSDEEAVQTLFEATQVFHHPGLVLEHKDENREALLQRVVEVLLAGLHQDG